MIDLLSYFFYAVVVWCVVLLARNEFVHKARMAILDESMNDYERLPTYRDMVQSPKYITLWTADHWRAWLGRHNA